MKQTALVYSTHVVAAPPRRPASILEQEQERDFAMQTHSVSVPSDSQRPVEPIKVKLDEEKLREAAAGVDPASIGWTHQQAVEARSRLEVWAEDWDDPEMDEYNVFL